MVMQPNFLSAEDHLAVSAAVRAAEAKSDGEIGTIVATASDDYHDWVLRWSLLFPLGWIAIMALWPHHLENWLLRLTGGWHEAFTPGEFLAATLAGQLLLFLLVRLAMMWDPLRLALVPGPVKARRVRAAAIRAFRIGTESRTRAATGVLIYLSLAEHRAEIVAEESINSRVDEAVWGDAMDALIADVRRGQVAQGIIAAVAMVGDVIAEHFPRSHDDINELPDRLIEL